MLYLKYIIIILHPVKIEIKREMLFDCQLEITDLYNTPIGNFKTLVPNIFDKKSICFTLKTCNFT